MLKEHQQGGVGDGQWAPSLSDAELSLDTTPQFPDGVAAAAPAAPDHAGLTWPTEPLSRQTEPIACRSKPWGPRAPIGTLSSGNVTEPRSMMSSVASAQREIAARFRLVDKVHQSSMSTVWRAVDVAQQTAVAVKVVPLALAPAFDAKTLARLVRVSAHPGLVTLIEHGWQGQWWYQVATWVDGKTLASRCGSHSGSSAHYADLQMWMKQLAGALEAQHRAGFVHGDVKPSNVLVTRGQACLIDLVGLRAGASWTRHSGLTPAFASPEARAGASADPRDDVYGLAAMLLQLLTGKLPNPEWTIGRQASPPAGVTGSQWRVLRQALDPDRDRRIDSVMKIVHAMWPGSPNAQGQLVAIPGGALSLAAQSALTTVPFAERLAVIPQETLTYFKDAARYGPGTDARSEGRPSAQMRR